MPQDAKCPKCDHTFPVTEARQAFTVACPRCETEMTVEFKKPEEFERPEEFESKLAASAKLRAAFAALTPGRQRGYLRHFSQPKLSATRVARVEKNIPRILEGRGLDD